MDSLAKKMKKKPSKIEEMSKEQIRQAIQKKRECNLKAQSIVESLLENQVSKEHFLQCLSDINQSHLDDVIEERSIVHLCGYPLCSRTLSVKDIPKQKYRISIKTNKVYDITARKSFCSNDCYEGAMYVKKQMLSSPLWFREYEEVPKFNLLPHGTGGSMGQVVDVAIVEKLHIKTDKTSQFTTINDFTHASLTEMSNNTNKDETILVSCQESGEVQSGKMEFELKEKTQTDDRSSEKSDCGIDNATNTLQTNAQSQPSGEIQQLQDNRPLTKHSTPKPNLFNIVGEIVEKPEKKIDPLTEIPESRGTQLSKLPKAKMKKELSVAVITIEVEKCLAEWTTLDTLLFLMGEEKVKEMVVDKGECIKEYLNNYAKSVFYNSNTYDQYQTLCRKLNMLELEDRKFDSQALQRESKPLPDYSILQKESKKLQLKVKAFLAGDTEIPEVGSSVEQTGVIEDNPALTKIPLVDKNAQNALRRKIVCNHLNKVLPDILRSLGLLTLSISEDVRLLVNTFKLKANNIMFKPVQWTLITIVIIKLLSLRDLRLQHLLKQQKAFQHMQLLLLMFKQDDKYLDRLISWLTDVDRLLNTNDTQLTMEM